MVRRRKAFLIRYSSLCLESPDPRLELISSLADPPFTLRRLGGRSPEQVLAPNRATPRR